MPVKKKKDHQYVENCRTVFLPVFTKMFESGVYKAMLKHFVDNDPISSNQSGFKPGDSCIYQLIEITHIFKCIDDGLEKRNVGLDISKAFDNVWHEGHIYKSRLISI